MVAGKWRKYQNVARGARKWLEVPKTSTPNKRVFSICGLVNTAKWSNPLRVLIEMKVFYNNNIKIFINFKNIVLVFTLISKPQKTV